MNDRLTFPDEELKRKFLALKSSSDVAELLEVNEDQLNVHIHRLPPSKRYAKFSIPKKNGGTRLICAPISPLKILQRKLRQVLQAVYEPKLSVQGYVTKRNIVTNAQGHIERNFVLNIDLKDFFPSIHFGRVRGLLMAVPYGLTLGAATTIAQICCFEKTLPQGAPTSPIISNMICARMDTQLQRLAKQYRCFYSRYADDLSFSTNARRFPAALATANDVTGEIQIGHELKKVIEENGFSINTGKVRLQHKTQRLEVTGLTVNEFPNVQRRFVRNIRSILHDWEKNGIKVAQERFNQIDSKYRSNGIHPPLPLVVKGKIEFLGMVRGKEDRIYLKYLSRLKELAPELVRQSIPNIATAFLPQTTIRPRIFTEGKTDTKHLKSALRYFHTKDEFLDIEPIFDETEQDTGWSNLLSRCAVYASSNQHEPHIFIFDRDVKQDLGEKCFFFCNSSSRTSN